MVLSEKYVTSCMKFTYRSFIWGQRVPELRYLCQNLTIRHVWVLTLDSLADLVLEQEIRGRRSFRRVRVARLLDPLPFYDLPLLGMVSLAFTDPVGLGRNDWELWGRRHHLFHIQLRVHPHRWTSREGRPHWRHRLDDLEGSGSKAMKHMSILVADFCTLSHSI